LEAHPGGVKAQTAGGSARTHIQVLLELWVLNTEGWRLTIELWTLFLEPWRLKQDSWNLTLEPWRLKQESWNLTLEPWRLLIMYHPNVYVYVG
jgi:hypothetical protein